MKKVIGVILLLVCALGIYLNSNEFEIKFINQKGLNETTEAKEYEMNDLYIGQNIHQEPDYSQMTDAQRAVRGIKPNPGSEEPIQDTTKEKSLKEWKKTWMNKEPNEDAQKELTVEEQTDQQMTDFYFPGNSNRDKIQVNYENEPGTLTPEDTEKGKYDILLPFVLLGILGIYFVTRKRN